MSKLDMDKILDELVSFDGISHSCIYQNEQIMASTFSLSIQIPQQWFRLQKKTKFIHLVRPRI